MRFGSLFLALVLYITIYMNGGSVAMGSEAFTLADWELTFSDDFSSDMLDQNKWNLQDPWGSIRNNELQGYMPDAFVLAGGMLHIKAEKRTVWYGGKVLPYASGMVTTYRKFAQQYGYFEIRCQVPAGKGLWPAFWLLPVPLGWPPEIDILEELGHEPTRMYFTNHWSENGKHVGKGDSFIGPDFSQDFHVIGMEWTPDTIKWYVDGVMRWQTSIGIPHQPMYMLLNLAVGGDWPGAPNTLTAFPAYFTIDYIRVYKRVGNGESDLIHN